MKRFFFLLIALAAVTIGCTKSGLVEVPQSFETPISFDPYTGKAPTTKATVMDEDALKADMTTLKGGFHVFAFTRTGEGGSAVVNYVTPYMDENVWWAAATASGGTDSEEPEDDNTETVADGDETQEGEGSTSGTPSTTPSGTWDYEGKAYWPEGALDFVAYGLNAERHMDFATSEDFYDGINPNAFKRSVKTGGSTFAADSPHKVFTYTVPTLVSDQEDLIVSNPQLEKTKDNTGSAINLPFYHLLSKVGFSLQTNDDPEGVNVTIKKIELKGDFYSNGSVDLTKTMNVGTAEKPDFRPFIDVPETQAADVESYSLFGMMKTNSQTNTQVFIDYNAEAADSYDCFVISAADAMDVTPIAATHTLTVTANPTDDVPVYSQSTSLKANATPLNRYMMIIPCTPGSTTTPASIRVTYEITGDIERTAEAQLAGDFTFDAGKGYEFVLKVSTLRVDFSVKVDDYTNGTVEDSYTLTPVIPEEEETPDQGA